MKSPMKKILAVAMTAVGCATIASAGVANSISGIHSVKTHYPWDGKVDISYTSTDPSGTGRILLDVGPTKRCITLTGADITVAPHKKTYDLHEMFGEFKTEVLASVAYEDSQPPDDAKGTPTGILGDLMTIEVGLNKTEFAVKNYKNVDIGKFNCETYKKTKIALLRIPAGGIWPARPGSALEDKVATTIAPAKDYWISIFPVTSAQFTSVIDIYGYAMEWVYPWYDSYNRIRGGNDKTLVLPTETVKSGSFMDVLAQKTKLDGKFDLPTEMQWEIAARAGSTSPFGHFVKEGNPVDGKDHVRDFAWFFTDNEYHSWDVGQLCPNMWGLYDMMGNVYEWCLDQYEDTAEWKDVETPHFRSESNLRVIRGGWYNGGWQDCRPSHRLGKDASNPGDNDSHVGFRVCFMPK